MSSQAIYERGSTLADDLTFIRGIRGVLNHRARAVEYRTPCNDWRWSECWLFWTWCDYAFWGGEEGWDIEEGTGPHVCISCERRAVNSGMRPSGRIPMSACEITQYTRWCVA